MTDYNNLIKVYINDFLKKLSENQNYSVIQAMEYSLSDGGKRIRPSILLEFCKIFGGKVEDALPIAVSLEFIHTFSLIHDDLPCMDNDNIRRGKPSCHIAFSENIALLAGDALLTESFGLICNSNFPDSIKCSLISEFVKFTGMKGMILGQNFDIIYQKYQNSKNIELSETEIIKMYSLKTGALLKLSAKAGIISAGIKDNCIIENALNFALNFALCFQLADDIDDIEKDAFSYAVVFGKDAATKKLSYFYKEAEKYLKNIPKSDYLNTLLEKILRKIK